MNNEHPNAKIEEKRKAAENVKHDQRRSTTHCGEHPLPTLLVRPQF